ncbi:MAG: TrkA family potassium uptake protein [Clostridiales bacterium]|nr:TrkA family potassium uptake protein [Clostridiales bacterium]
MSAQKKQYAVFGIGRFGSALCKELSELGHEVLAVDASEENVNAIAPYVTQAIQLNATDEEAIHSLGVRNFDAVVVSIGGNLRDSIMITLLCKELGAKYLLAKASDELHAKMLKKMGADRVVFPERDMGVRVAKTLVSPRLLDLINLSGDYMMADIAAPQSWVGRTIHDIDIRKRYNVSVLVINRAGDVMMNLTAETRLEAGDDLLMLGHRSDIQRIEELN